MVIAYNGNGYPEKRLIIDKTKFQYKKISKHSDIWADVLRAACIINKNLINSDNLINRTQFQYKPICENFDIIHLYNTVYYGKKPWISSFERNFPTSTDTTNQNEYRMYANKAKPYILSDNCKALLPISNAALNSMINCCSTIYCEDDLSVIKKKCFVLAPPQKLLTNSADIIKKYSNQRSDKAIQYIFIGRDFWRKGGEIVIKAFSKLWDYTHQFHVTIISNLQKTGKGYELDCDLCKDILNSADWITWYKELPNNKVLELIKKMDIGLLPTFDDTYGFSVLEMQASGCPCVTTDIYAQPEINNRNLGWVIHIDNLLSRGNYNYSNFDLCSAVEKKAVNDLYNILIEIQTFNNYETILQKALLGLNEIAEKHSPEKYTKRLLDIYTK